MIYDDLFLEAIEEFAKEEKFELIINKNQRTKLIDGYILRKESFVLGFTTFVDKEGNFNVIKSKRLQGKPEIIAQFTLDELKDKKTVKAVIKAKLL